MSDELLRGLLGISVGCNIVLAAHVWWANHSWSRLLDNVTRRTR